MTTFTKIHELNTNAISLTDEGRITYNSKPLRVQTGIVLCTLDDKKLKFEVSAAGHRVLQDINSLIENYADLKGMDHYTLSNPLNLTVGPWTRYFDSNKAPMPCSSLCSEFTASILLEFSNIIEYNGKLLLSIKVLQILVRTYNQLPRGCMIFTSVDDLHEHQTRESSRAHAHAHAHASESASECEFETGQDLNVNELLD